MIVVSHLIHDLIVGSTLYLSVCRRGIELQVAQHLMDSFGQIGSLVICCSPASIDVILIESGSEIRTFKVISVITHIRTPNIGTLFIALSQRLNATAILVTNTPVGMP